MKIPEGWPTKEMVEAAIDNLPNVNKEDVVFSLKAALAAAPTPPVQEDEPVAVIDETAILDGNVIFNGAGNVKPGDKLYTRPANSELRKAAEDALLILRCLSVDKNLTESWRDKADRAANGLSVALDIAK